MRTPTKKPTVNINTEWTPEQKRQLDANAVASAVFCACSTCCRIGGAIHDGKFECLFPIVDGEDKPPCSINVIAADVIDVQNGGSADLTKYTQDFVVSMIQQTDLIPKKQQAATKAAAVVGDALA